MKTLKIKELGLFIIFILSGLLCGLMGVFAIPTNKQAFAEEPSKIEISNDEANPWTESNGKYSCNVRGGLLSETKTTLTITIEGNGLLNFSYTKSNGDLSISYNGETLNKSSSGTLNVILTNEGSNVITISCSGPAPLRTGKASVGPFTLTTPTYKISAVSNNTEFGNVYFQNDDYVIGKEVTVTSVIEEGCIFLGYLDQDKNVLSTNQVYTFNVTKALQITGVFARLDGSNTNQDPYQFNTTISVVNEYCLDNSSLTYILIPNGICADYYIAESLDYSLVIDSVTQTATDGKYHISLQRGETKYVNFVSGLKTFIFVITNPGTGIASSTITLGGGTDLDPYLISTEDNLQQINLSLSSVFKIVNDIYITKDFTPLGNSSTKFTGKLIGNNKTIYNLKTAVGDYRGLFAYTYGASIQDLNLEDANIYAKSYGAFLIAYSENKTTINNVHVSGVLHYTVSDKVNANWGGLVGFAVNDSGLRASNCSVGGTIDGNAYTKNVGGFSGSGGTFSNCIMKAEVTGISVVGGMTSGYAGSKLANNSNFTNCFVEGAIKMMGQFKNNYPYVGLINGYGAWETYGVTGSGQNISMNLTTVNSDITVENITIFGSNVSPDGINVAFNKNGNKYSFKKSVVITKTCGLANVSIGDVLSGNISALSETSVTGITSNYGGLTIRIKMSNGTYKYVSTLNKKTNAIESNFDINLDDLTSYVDNFSNIEIDTTIGTSSDNDKGDGIATWGTALVTNANDFEHLSWIISGGIPTTFKNNIYYNSRSVATISIKLLNDIDLTAPRYAKLTNNILSLYAENEEVLDNSFVLNSKDNSNIENLNYNFEGLGRSEMSPYRGSLYGNSKTLTVNMNFPNAHLVGIINISTEQKEKIYVKNLTVEGTIVGGYKVGIVGMQDNYERSTALYFVEVTNNANISAKSQVGGLLGEAQGEASIFAENCVNNGNITATDGDAGGLLGSLAYYTSSPATCKLTNCQNNGRVSATKIAGGLVATTNGVTISGENSNSGVVLGETKENCYVGEFLKTSTYTYENGKLVTIYKLILGTPNFEYTINDTSFIAQQDGNIFARFENQPIVEGLSIIVSGALKTSSYSFDANKYTMFTDLSGIFPKEFALLNEKEYKLIKTDYPEISANDYDISENEFNDIKMLVTFGNNTYSVITVTPNITNNQYQSNQLIFVNTSFTHNDYNIPNTVVETLKRISIGVKEFTTLVDSLTTKTSGTNSEFYDLGYNIKTRLDSLTLELTAYSQNDLTRFKAYVNSNATTKNNEDIFNVLQTYFNNIVSSSNISEMLSNISLNYGTYSFSKPLTFNMLSGITPNPTKTITYSGAKEDITLNEDNSFSLVLQTEGVSFSAYGITTFSYNSPCSVQINKLDFSVVFTNETFTYDGTKKELQTTINCVENDDVGIKVLYLKQDETEPKQTNIGVGTYSVIIDELTGEDRIYYNFPTYEYGKLIISPISVTLNVQDNQSFTYNKENVSPEVSINGLTLNTNYIITFSGENYSSNEAPINAGAYTASISLLQNFYSLNKTSYNFTINPKPITNITLNTITYCNQNANTKIRFESFEGLIEGDSINTVIYEIYDKAGDISLAKTVGEYSVYVSAIDNSNYTVENLTQAFTLNVIPTEVEISLNPLTSVYGENVSNVLNTLTCSVTNGILYDDISALNIVAVKEGGNNAGEYNLSANYNNNNYNVSFVDSIHTIAPLKVEIDFKQTSFMYNATNQIESIKPEVKIVENQEGVTENNTALSNDIKYFTFSLYLNNIKVEEFINFGDYLLKLDEHEILSNYTITKTQQTYKITKYNVNINISADNVEETYNKLLTLDKFSITHTNLLQNDEITDLVSVEYKVYKGEEIINNISYLDVGLYTIKLIVTPNNSENSKYNNYNLGDISNGELHIIERQTYIELENNKITKIYDLTPCVISAKLFALDGEEITGAEFVYEIYCNGEKIDEAIEVGHYDVVITALSDGNNEEALASCSIDITANNVEFSLTNNEKTYNALAFDLQYSMTFDVQVDISNYVRYKFLDSNKQETKNITSAGNYFVEFGIVDENEEINDNFVIKNSVLSFNINPIDLSIKVEDKQITYNEPFNIDNCNYILLSGELLQGEELDLIYRVENLSTNAGTYTITATNYNTNYNVVINAGTLTINKIILKLTYFGKDSLEYNQNGQTELLQVQVNNALSNDVYSVYYLNSKNIKVENVVNVDMYRLVVKINDTTNYAFENTTDTIISRNIEIYKKVLDIKIVVSNKVYDGEYINIDSITVNNQTLLEDLYLLEFYKDSALISIPKDNGTYTVKVVENYSDGWSKVNYNDIVGYCKTEYLVEAQ